MKAVIDQAGRILVPKTLREAHGFTPGSTVDISWYGDGLRVIPGGRTARLEHDADGRLVARGDTPVDDDDLFALIDAGRR
ncbi:MAG: AbrB/MazE/SpoVT family DNA-binding domain-containing protein [Tessaracoccus sp.]